VTHSNLIADGDFSSNGYAWHAETLAGSTTAFVVYTGEGCTLIESGTQAGLGWPVSPALPANLVYGQSYTLTYTVVLLHSKLASGYVEAKVGSDQPPYYMPVDGDFLYDTVSTVPTTHVHTVTPTSDDPNAGLSFLYDGYPSDEICYSNVSLIQN
jgi:hypothetical protein